MGIFNKKEQVKPINPNQPDLDACETLFNDICGLMYKEGRRSIIELEIVFGMLQNEIIMNKVNNAIMAQVGRLAFLPAPMFAGLPQEETLPESKADGKGQHYG